MMIADRRVLSTNRNQVQPVHADSLIRRLYLLALIDETKRPQIHGHPTICQTAAQTKEMMATPAISRAMNYFAASHPPA